MLDLSAANLRSGVGTITFTGIRGFLPANSLARPHASSGSPRTFSAHPRTGVNGAGRPARRRGLNLFRIVMRAVVRKPPGGHLLRFARCNSHDDVAVPRPRVLAIELRWPRRMIRV